MPDERRYLQSKFKKKTCNPKFEESFVFQVPPPPSMKNLIHHLWNSYGRVHTAIMVHNSYFGSDLGIMTETHFSANSGVKDVWPTDNT